MGGISTTCKPTPSTLGCSNPFPARSQNRKIRELLAGNGFEQPNVKGVGLQVVEIPKQDMLENMPDANKNKETKKYYEQSFKIACPNIEYSTVMDFLTYLVWVFQL